MIEIVTLGGFEMRLAGESVPVASKKSRALLAFLGMQNGQAVARDRLAGLLWEDSNDTQARHSLRQALAALRKLMGGAGTCLVAETDAIALAEGVAVDAVDLADLVMTGSTDSLRSALDSYKGDFLDGLNPRSASFEDWQLVERERLRELVLRGSESLLNQLQQDGALEPATQVALRMVALDPIREPIHRSLMTLYASQGQHAAALRQYRRCRDTLRRVLGVTPEPETETLYRDIVARRAAPTPSVSPGPAEVTLDAEQPRNEPVSNDSTEPRHVTVLSVALADFLMVTRDLDAEGVHQLLSEFRALVLAAVKNYGGRLMRQDNNELSAIFGVPKAQASDALRALRAAQEMHEHLTELSDSRGGHTLRARAGIASGPLLVTMRGDEINTISGPPIKFADHLAVSCKPGEVMVTDDVHSAAAGWTEAERIADFLVHDDAQPTVWRVNTVHKSMRSLRAVDMVGREAEQRQFEVALAACGETETGQTFQIRGEAGIGKTRLAQALCEHAQAKGFVTHNFDVLELGANNGEDTIQSLTRYLLGLDGNATHNDVARALRASFGEAQAVVDQEHMIELLGLASVLPKRDPREVDASAERRARKNLLTRLVASLGDKGPSVLCVEDIHWADDPTIDYLGALARGTADSAVILLMTCRVEGDPQETESFAALRGSPLITIELGPLRDQEARELAAQHGEFDDSFVERCVTRAQGNPLFLEQLLRSPQPGAQTLPDSVQRLAWARLDTLSEHDRLAAQCAAVLGQRFTLEALRHLVDDADYDCQALVDRRLIDRENDEYGFSHALIAEGIYASLLGSRRREIHLQSAQWFSARDNLPLAAHHLEQAEHERAAKAYLDAAVEMMEAKRYDVAATLSSRGIALAADSTERFALTMLNADALRQCGEAHDASVAYRMAAELDVDEAERARVLLLAEQAAEDA